MASRILKWVAPPHRLYVLCLHLAVGASIWGYNIGVLSSILIHPGFRSLFSRSPAPESSSIYTTPLSVLQPPEGPSPSQKGLVTGIYYLGTLLSYLFLSHPLADWLGRRKSCAVGSLTLALGAVIMASASDSHVLTLMVLGRWLCGVGVGMVSTGVPLYQSEVAPAKERGKFVTMNHVGFVAGLASGLWVGYLMTFWTSARGHYWGWRVSILIQLIPAFVFLIGLPFAPESPRWLLSQGQSSQARSNLTLLRPLHTKFQISHELHTISRDIPPKTSTMSRLQSFQSLTLSLFRSPALFSRLWRAFLLQFLAQLCGATAMKYYLPTLLQALGISERASLMAGALEMTIKVALTVVEMWLIDKLGRRVCLVGGSLIMALGMAVNGVLPLVYPANKSTVADVICIVFIFVYAMGYSLGLGPAAWVYSSEIFPTPVRARGLNFAASGGAVGSIIVSQIWPVGIKHLGSGIYFFFMAVNLISVVVMWRLYPETKGRALEDMDALFGQTAAHSNQSILTLHRAYGEEDDESLDVPHHERTSEDWEEEDDPLLS